MTTRRRPGFSLPEILIGLALFGILLVAMRVFFFWNRSAINSMEKTNLAAKLRNSSIILNRSLALATEFLYPATIGPDYVHQIIFRNRDNHIVGIFLNDKNTLSMYNYSTDEFRDITPFTIGFKGRRVKQNLMEYQIDIKKDQFQFSIQNQLSTCNTLP
ncbi:MAG: prepilin-type N-terminal cleavage/methylation domain-containing protein [Candidatus Riflebacteria bacterium]|nr:prepilin-type N-terminal cleavage/methylation domain-containing protein [Candidatus Riflebacteria bacterium]